MQNNWVIDWETLINCSVLCAEHYKTDEKKNFVIHESRNDYPELIDFLETCKKEGSWHIGFNSISFDSQLTEYCLREKENMLKMSGEEISVLIYNKAQEVIQKSNNREWSEWGEKDLSIKQLDIFKTNHWDNVQRSAGLKWIQYAMDWPNLQDMPIHHSTYITGGQISDIVTYCFNDVASTKNIINLSKASLGLRAEIFEKYGVNCFSYSNTKMGSELLLKLYCKHTGTRSWDIRKLRTGRNGIHIKDILFPYIKFKSPELNAFMEILKNKVIFNTKKDFKHTVKLGDIEFDYGAGGIHQCISSGVYHSDEYFVIMDFDVASLYPSIAIANKMYPAHLGPEFYQVYKEEIVDVRLREKAKGKDGNKAITEGFKEAANASYGNSNSEHSWLYDPQYTMQTTINGQLMLTMLCEDILINIPEAQLLQTNTDGATFKIPRHTLDIYKTCCKSWEDTTKLQLEFVEYKSMFIRDVNNYISVTTTGKTKCKGTFEWEDLQNYKPSHLHKNKSYLVIAKAVYEYFVNGIEPDKYLESNRNIYDYCAGTKIKGDWTFYETCVVNQRVIEVPLQKTLRYYISDKGCKIIKRNNSDGREIQVQAGRWEQMLFNNYQELPWKDYHVDMRFYKKEIQKEIDNILGKKQLQTDMFIENE